MKLKKVDVVFIIAMVVLTIISLDLLYNVGHQKAITNIWQTAPFKNIITGLWITFVVCVVGNLLPVPTPYSWVVCGGFSHLKTNIFLTSSAISFLCLFMNLDISSMEGDVLSSS